MRDDIGRIWGRVSPLLFLLVLVIAAIWVLGAIWFQSAPPWRYAVIALPAIMVIGLFGLRRRRGGTAGWIGLAVALAGVAIWWGSIRPTNVADWAPDVAHGVTAELGERDVLIHGIRNFDWITETQAVERWKSERYDPNTITSLDLASSVWDSPAIAHTLVSFGFADGRRLAFSAETRRRRDQTFSSLGGFFKTFGLVLVAAEETDILRLRTNVRREQLSLFPLRASPEQKKALFLTYLQAGNELARTPRFYDTATANCTTVIFDLARHIGSTLPYSWQILVSGYLPEYLYRERLIRSDLPWPEVKGSARVSQLGQAAAAGEDYSAAIRSGRLFKGPN